MLQGRGSSGQRTRYPDTDMSMESTPTPHAAAMVAGGQHLAQPLPPDAALGPVLRREQPDPATWTGTEYRLVLCLHSISLTQEVGAPCSHVTKVVSRGCREAVLSVLVADRVLCCVPAAVRRRCATRASATWC